MREMSDLIKDDPTNTMEWKEEGGVNQGQLQEERVVSSCLNNMRLHAKVKLLVNGLINEFTC